MSSLARSVVLAVLAAAAGAPRAEPLIHHAHGLAFLPDGKTLVVPAHIGIAAYRDGRWSRAPGPVHDYMGFSAAQGAIYSSGHPAPGSSLRNPLGLVKSTDGGATWQTLALGGEADFHVMASSWRGNAVYVVNAEPNSKMPQPGLYHTRNEGKTWTRGEAAGVNSQILALAAHPTDAATLAIGTLRDGAMLSRDAGKTFRPLGAQEPVTAVVFEHGGKALLYAEAGAPALIRRPLGRDLNERVKLPALGKDFVAFIAQNPADPKALAVVTRNRSVFLSRDAGASWRQIAREGDAQ